LKTATLLLVATLFTGSDAAAQTAEKPRAGYEAFQFARTRNIFDPNRQARSEAPRREQGPPKPPRSRPNFLTLTGTMVTGGKSFAFFSGAGSESSKVAGVGERVSDYKIAAINPADVQLEKGGKSVALGVGKQLTLEGTILVAPALSESAPAVAAAPAASSTPADPAVPGTAPPATAEPSSGGPSDVLKKMMERRQKEMTK